MKDTNFNSISLFITSLISVIAICMVINALNTLRYCEQCTRELKVYCDSIDNILKTHDSLLNEYPYDDVNKYDSKLEDLYESNIEK